MPGVFDDLKGLKLKPLFDRLHTLVSDQPSASQLKIAQSSFYTGKNQFEELRVTLNAVFTRQDTNVPGLLSATPDAVPIDWQRKQDCINGLQILLSTDNSGEKTRIIGQFKDKWQALITRRALSLDDITDAWQSVRPCESFPFTGLNQQGFYRESGSELGSSTSSSRLSSSGSSSHEVPSLMQPAVHAEINDKWSKMFKNIWTSSLDVTSFIIINRHSICWTAQAIGANSTKTFVDLACSYQLKGQGPWFAAKFIAQWVKIGKILPAILNVASTEIVPYISNQFVMSEEEITYKSLATTFLTAIGAPILASSCYFISTEGLKKTIHVVTSNFKYLVGGHMPRIGVGKVALNPLFVLSASGLIASSLGYTVAQLLQDAYEQTETNYPMLLGSALALGTVAAIIAAPAWSLAAVSTIIRGSISYTIAYGIPSVVISDALYHRWSGRSTHISGNSDLKKIDPAIPAVEARNDEWQKFVDNKGKEVVVKLEKIINKNPGAFDFRMLKFWILGKMGEGENFIEQMVYIKANRDKLSPTMAKLLASMEFAYKSLSYQHLTEEIKLCIDEDDFPRFTNIIDNNPELRNVGLTPSESRTPMYLPSLLIVYAHGQDKIETYLDYSIAPASGPPIWHSTLSLATCSTNCSRAFYKYVIHMRKMHPKSGKFLFDQALQDNNIDLAVLLLVEGVQPTSTQIESINNNTPLLERFLLIADQYIPFFPTHTEQYVHYIGNPIFKKSLGVEWVWS